MTAVQAEEVMQYQHLAIALRAGADADGRHVHRRRDLGSDRGRHAFEHHDAGAGSGHGPGIFHQLARGIASALDLEATQAQHRLRGQAQMRADRDLALDQIADDVDLEAGTFDLDHLGTGLQQLQRGIQRAFGRSVGAKRQVGHQQRALRVEGQCHWRIEARRIAHAVGQPRTPTAGQRTHAAIGADHPDAIVERIGHVDLALRIHRDAHRGIEARLRDRSIGMALRAPGQRGCPAHRRQCRMGC
ncbi:hypothetical protein G6F24_014655 [Rhizopus arrhizus]|nr:hypothetical protein G6F24_014655 [Rhizopus arrhizus]